MADLGLLELVLAVIDFFTMDAIKDYPGVQVRNIIMWSWKKQAKVLRLKIA